MNRHHTADMYRRIVDGLRTARPDMALSSDFIVGYPGETEADFKATLALIETVGYAQAFSFKFSARPGTPAADLPDQMPEDLKSARLTELQALLEHQQRAFNAAQIGQRAPVLFERTGREAGQVSGRNPFMQWVHVSAPLHRIGRVADVTITDAHANSLSGILVGASNDHLQGDPATRGSAEPATSEGPVA
jgi:tRNA-2-methylthio-N6-dimethylallyladenosine synthase